MLIKMANKGGVIEQEHDEPIMLDEVESAAKYHARYLIEPQQYSEHTIFANIQPQQSVAVFGAYSRLWMCCGVGYGKTWTGSRFAYRHISELSPGGRGLIAANTREQLTAATLPPFFEMLDLLGLDRIIHCIPPASWGAPRVFDSYKNVLCVLVRPGVVAQILLRSLVNFAAIKGVELEWAWVDEIADSPEEGINVITDRMRGLRTVKRQLLLTGSPMGDENWAWKRFDPVNNKEISKHTGRPLHEIVFASSLENPVLPLEYHELQKSTHTEKMYKQQVHGRIITQYSGLTYYSFSKENNDKLKYKYNPNKPLLWSWDFNVGAGTPMCSVIGQVHFDHTLNMDVIQILCEVVIMDGNIQMVIDEAMSKPWLKEHPGGWEIYGDATQQYKSASMSDFIVIYEELALLFNDHPAYGRDGTADIELMVKSINPKVRNRINSVNVAFRAAGGITRLYLVGSECPVLVRDLKRLRRNEKENKDLDKKTDKKLSHASDALGYLVYYYMPLDLSGLTGIAANTRKGN